MQGYSSQDLSVTSKHKTLGQVDWSRQLSREVPPYFIPQPTAQSRVQMSSGADRPRRHQTVIDMERGSLKQLPPKVDARDYQPKLYEELHPHCGVDIGRAPARGQVFGEKKHDSEVVVDVAMHPGWGRGKKSAWPRASRCEPDAPSVRSVSATPVFSAYTPIPETPAFESLESRLERPKGGYIPRADERAFKPNSNHGPLEINEHAVRRSTPGVDLATSSRHFASKERRSEKYREMFRTPPPGPLTVGEKRRITNGYAPQRQTFDRSVSSLLAMADADRRRAKKLVEQNFAAPSRSSVRSSMLYTPSPAASPSPTGRD